MGRESGDRTMRPLHSQRRSLLVKSIVILGGGAMFLAGAAVSLLASYPISKNNLYVCFVAMFVALAACVLAAVTIALYAARDVNSTTRAERVRADHLVKMTVDEMLNRRSLERIDRRD